MIIHAWWHGFSYLQDNTTDGYRSQVSFLSMEYNKMVCQGRLILFKSPWINNELYDLHNIFFLCLCMVIWSIKSANLFIYFTRYIWNFYVANTLTVIITQDTNAGRSIFHKLPCCYPIVLITGVVNNEQITITAGFTQPVVLSWHVTGHLCSKTVYSCVTLALCFWIPWRLPRKTKSLLGTALNPLFSALK